MITEKQFAQIMDELEHCQKPLFFFDDDPDGLCSFLLFYRYKKEGKGIVVKSQPKVDFKFVRKVEEYQPDKVFVLDVPKVDRNFVDNINIPIVWVDHHGPYEVDKVKYFNPRLENKGDNIPTSLSCYSVVKQDLWIAMIGTVGDWFLPKIKDEFIKIYPKLLPKSIKKPEDALFKTELGKLVKIFSFVLKGKTQDVMKGVKILTRINDPYEILEQKTPAGKFIYKRYEKINKEYESLLKKGLKVGNKKEKILKFIYEGNTMSFTKELSNELLYNYPDKLILVAREKSGEMKCSLRCSKLHLPTIMENALKGVSGYGGGHEHACGGCVKVEDFDLFVKQLKEQI